MVGEERNEEEREEAHEPPGALEGIREAKNAGSDDGDEDVGEGLGLGRQRLGVADQRRVLRRGRLPETLGRGGCLLVATHILISVLILDPELTKTNNKSRGRRCGGVQGGEF